MIRRAIRSTTQPWSAPISSTKPAVCCKAGEPMKKRGHLFGNSCAILFTSILIGFAHGEPQNHEDAIPPWTLALEKRLQPWCPAGCVDEIPFTATYGKNGNSLVFVGVHHVFTPQ